MKRNEVIAWVACGILAILLIIMMSGCSPEYYQNKYCPKVKDSTHVERERYDSLIEHTVIDTVPGDTIRDTVKIPCKDFKYRKENKRQKVSIEVKDGEMIYEGICKEWEFKYKVSEWHHTLIEKTFHSETRQVLRDRPKTFWYWLSFWQSWAAIGLILLIISIWQRKRILGLLLKLIKPL